MAFEYASRVRTAWRELEWPWGGGAVIEQIAFCPEMPFIFLSWCINNRSPSHTPLPPPKMGLVDPEILVNHGSGRGRKKG